MFGKQVNSLFCLVLIMLMGVVSSFAQIETIVENDFEKGTQKWEARGARVSISSSKDQALSGAKSLKISGRSDFWQGGQLNVTSLLAGKKAYKFTASIKLAKGEKPDDIKMTMERGNNQYSTISVETVNADGWTTLSGIFKYSGNDPYLVVYIEAARANTSYFIDDFKIELAGDNIPAQSGVLLKNDFEDMTAQDWAARGDEVQMFSSNAGGSQNLKVSARTKNWHGLQLDVSPTIFKGRTYEFSIQVRLVKGQTKDSVAVTMQETPPKGEPKYTSVVPPTAVTDAEWVTLTGKYTASTADHNLVVFIEAAGATTAFHIDNFTIKIP